MHRTPRRQRRHGIEGGIGARLVHTGIAEVVEHHGAVAAVERRDDVRQPARIHVHLEMPPARADPPIEILPLAIRMAPVVLAALEVEPQRHHAARIESRDLAKISEKLGLEKGDVQATVESFMEEVKNSLETGDNVYLRGFGSFIIKTRAEKTGRNISKNTTIKIPAHNIPAFKPAKVFVEGVKTNNEAK